MRNSIQPQVRHIGTEKNEEKYENHVVGTRALTEQCTCCI
jgi:hypothetical protein